MKYFLFTLIMLSVVLLSERANANPVSYKCYVEYAGGGDGINFIESSNSSTSYLASILKSKPIYALRFKKKVSVLNVIECVKESSSFKNGRAQILDQETPR